MPGNHSVLSGLFEVLSSLHPLNNKIMCNVPNDALKKKMRRTSYADLEINVVPRQIYYQFFWPLTESLATCSYYVWVTLLGNAKWAWKILAWLTSLGSLSCSHMVLEPQSVLCFIWLTRIGYNSWQVKLYSSK